MIKTLMSASTTAATPMWNDDPQYRFGKVKPVPTPVIPTAASMAAMSRQEITKANQEACRVIDAWLDANGYSDWCCKYVDWDDPSRAKGSCFGNNICDVYTKLRLTDGTWVNLFMLGPKNFGAKSVLCTAKDITVCISDADGQNPRLREGDEPVTLESVFRNAGEYFSHKGIKTETNLSTGADEPILFKNMAVFVQIPQGQEVQIATFVENYQSSATSATNALFHFTPQGASMADDAAPPGCAKMLLPEALDRVSGKVKMYYTKMDASNRDLSQVGQETAEEAAQAVAEGKSAEVPMGIKHPDMKKGNGFVTVIKPINAIATTRRYFSPKAMILAALYEDDDDYYEDDDYYYEDDEPIYMSVSSLSGPQETQETDWGFRSLNAGGDEPEETVPVYRGGSVRSKREASRGPAAQPPATVSKQGRCYRGDFVCDAPELAITAPEPNPTNGVATATHVHLVVTPPNTPPTTEDIKQCLEGLLLHELSLVGRLTNRHTGHVFNEIGATTETLSVKGAKGIAATIKAQKAPSVGVPVY